MYSRLARFSRIFATGSARLRSYLYIRYFEYRRIRRICFRTTFRHRSSLESTARLFLDLPNFTRYFSTYRLRGMWPVSISEKNSWRETYHVPDGAVSSSQCSRGPFPLFLETKRFIGSRDKNLKSRARGSSKIARKYTR